MIKFDKILFTTDFSRFANHALPYAVQLAKIFDSELTMLHVIVSKKDRKNKGPDKKQVNKLKDEALINLEKLTKNLPLDKGQIKLRTVFGPSVEEEILKFINKNRINLIVLGTYGLGWSGPFFLGSVVERITRHAPCAVLTISEKTNEEVDNILVPIDFSEYSKKALVMAKELASEFDARLTLLHVIEPGNYPSFYDIRDTNFKKMVDRTKNKSPDMLKKLLRDSPGPKVEADTHVVVGQAAYQVVKFINDYEPDLVVISSHGLSDIDYFLMGSVADKVIKRSKCPVLALKSY
jgi:nucleotide-binding universal stress UspA family protein